MPTSASPAPAAARSNTSPTLLFIRLIRGVQDLPAQRRDPRIVAMARIRQIDVDLGTDARRPLDSTIAAQKQCLLDVMGDEEAVKRAFRHSEINSCCMESRVSEFEPAERLVEKQQCGVVDQRAGERSPLRHAAGKLVRKSRGETVSPTSSRASSIRCCAARQDMLRACRPTADIVANVAQGNSVGSWKTSMRDGSGRSTGPYWRGSRLRLARSSPAIRRSKRGLAAPRRAEQGDELARRDEGRFAQHRQRPPAELESMADAANFDRDTPGYGGARRRRGPLGHQMTPFCQDSSRSRTTKRSFGPARSRAAAMMISVA